MNLWRWRHIHTHMYILHVLFVIITVCLVLIIYLVQESNLRPTIPLSTKLLHFFIKSLSTCFNAQNFLFFQEPFYSYILIDLLILPSPFTTPPFLP